MKVSQLDAELLDDELLETMKEQLWSAFALFKVTSECRFGCMHSISDRLWKG